jgi:hypothetical protein
VKFDSTAGGAGARERGAPQSPVGVAGCAQINEPLIINHSVAISVQTRYSGVMGVPLVEYRRFTASVDREVVHGIDFCVDRN